MSEESGKVIFIKTWFNLEKKKLPIIQRLELLKRWTESCVSFEEYEMAATLRIERGKEMRLYRDEINGKRGISKNLKIRLQYLIRKFNRLFPFGLLR